MAGPVWVLRLAIRRLWREWRRLTAPRTPRPYPPARKRVFSQRRSRFFVDAENRAERAGSVRELCPHSPSRTTIYARYAQAHRFHLFDYELTEPDSEIDWHVDFKACYRWPLEHHLRLTGPPLGSGPDIKVPWELSRCHHFVTLGKAFAFTGDDRYAQEFVAQVESWLVANPPGFGVNWVSPMEAAIRAVNWIWAYHFFEGAEPLTPDFQETFLDAMDAHGRYIIRNLETYWPPTNHLIANFCGLVYLGLMFPQLREAHRWLRRGTRSLLGALERQVHPDGVADEGSTGYHSLVTELFLSPILLLRLNEVPVPDRSLVRLEAMLEVIMASTRPDGHDPMIGDADDGRLHPLGSPELLTRASPRHLLASGAVFFNRPTLAATTLPDDWEDAAWLFGERSVETQSLVRERETRSYSVHFPEGGLVFMRHEDLYLSLDAGLHGHCGTGGHAHNDTLSITLSAHNRPFLIDSGTYAYTGDIEARNYFRSTSAHNTLQVDSAEINRFVPEELFRLIGDATPTVHRWESTPEYDLVDASHNGYVRLPGGVIHKRQILFDKAERFWLLRDVVSGEGEHGLTWPYHFTSVRVQEGPAQAVDAWALSGGLLILPLDAPDVRLALSEGWISQIYGMRHRMPLATYSSRAILPAIFSVVLYPYVAEQPPYDRARASGQRALGRLDALLNDETSSV